MKKPASRAKVLASAAVAAGLCLAGTAAITTPSQAATGIVRHAVPGRRPRARPGRPRPHGHQRYDALHLRRHRDRRSQGRHRARRRHGDDAADLARDRQHRRHLGGHVRLAGVRRRRQPDRGRGLHAVLRLHADRRHHAVGGHAGARRHSRGPAAREGLRGDRPEDRREDRRDHGSGVLRLPRAEDADRPGRARPPRPRARDRSSLPELPGDRRRARHRRRTARRRPT